MRPLTAALGWIVALSSAPAPAQESPHSIEPAVLHFLPGTAPASRNDPGVRPITLRVRFTIGEAGLRPQQSVRLGFGYPTSNDWGPDYVHYGGHLLGPSLSLKKLPFDSLQTRRPDSPNYATAHVIGRPELAVRLNTVRDRGAVELLEASTTAALPAGAQLEFVLGDRAEQRNEGLYYLNAPGHPAAVFLVESSGSDFELDRGPFPRLLSTAATVDNLYVSIPMTPALGAPFPISVIAMQGEEGKRGNLMRKADFVGDLLLECDPPDSLELPARASFEAGGRGALRVMAKALKPGLVAVRARLAQGEVAALSNVAVVESESGSEYLVGDSQRHSIAGGHATAPDDELWLQHFERGDDYATVVHHVAATMASWQLSNATARQFHERHDPEEEWFVAFPGYEWSKRGQHHHVVYRSFSRASPFSDKPGRLNGERSAKWAGNLEELLEGLSSARTPTIAIAHHSMWDMDPAPAGQYDWGPLDHPTRTTVEIFSGHGASDRHYDVFPPEPWDYPVHWNGRKHEQQVKEAGASVQDALAAGHRLGFVGGSDNHGWDFFWCARREDRWREKYGRQGLGVALGDRAVPRKRTRIFQALQQRHSYATTGHKSYLRFHIGALSMGDEGEVAAGTPFEVYAVASGVARNERARIVGCALWRDGHEQVARVEADAHEWRWSWTDPNPPSDDGAHPYYVQLFHDDLHVTWSSPIWVRYSESEPEPSEREPLDRQPRPEAERGAGSG